MTSNACTPGRRPFFTALLALLVATAGGCTTTGGTGTPDTRRQSIDTGVDLALENLYAQVEGSRALVNQASGVLVFPDVLRAGFTIAAARGHGALRMNGVTQSYHTTTSGSFGLQAGVQSTAVFLLFMTDEALRRFQTSTGWQVGADASVTVLSTGASAAVSTTTSQQPVIGFVLSNRGLMAGISLDGSRIVRLDL